MCPSTPRGATDTTGNHTLNLFSQSDRSWNPIFGYRPLGLREPAAFAHCISPLSLDEIRDMQGGITPANRRRTSSGRFETIPITSTESRMAIRLQNLLDDRVTQLKFRDTAYFSRWGGYSNVFIWVLSVTN